MLRITIQFQKSKNTRFHGFWRAQCFDLGEVALKTVASELGRLLPSSLGTKPRRSLFPIFKNPPGRRRIFWFSLKERLRVLVAAPHQSGLGLPCKKRAKSA
jgi:hypothetical protein